MKHARIPDFSQPVPVRITDPWKDTGGAWPNLLRSAANVAGIDPASLDHEYASTRADRA